MRSAPACDAQAWAPRWPWPLLPSGRLKLLASPHQKYWGCPLAINISFSLRGSQAARDAAQARPARFHNARPKQGFRLKALKAKRAEPAGIFVTANRPLHLVLHDGFVFLLHE